MRRLLIIGLALGAILGAAWLILLRGDIPFETLEDRYELSDSEYLSLEGERRIHFTDTGPDDAPIIVLVHGFSASLHTWNAWRAPLSEEYRVVSLDLPGHGLTRSNEDDIVSMDAFIETIEAVTDSLELDKFTLVGSSMGGRTAWNYTLARPDRVDALVLVGASGWAQEEGYDQSLVFKLMDTPFAGAVMKNLDVSIFFEAGLKDSFVDQSFVTDEMIKRYVDLSRAPGHRDMLYALQTSADQGAEASAEQLRQISVPTLILHGEVDNLVPVSGGRKFAEAIPGSVLITYPNVGHLPQEEIPGESLEDLRSFLDRTISAEPMGSVAVQDGDSQARDASP